MRSTSVASVIAVVTTAELTEIQPEFFVKRPLYPRSLICVCSNCGETWAKVDIYVGGERQEYQPRDTCCRDCGDGSFMQYPTRWSGVAVDPWKQKFGRQLMARELEIAVEQHVRRQKRLLQEHKEQERIAND